MTAVNERIRFWLPVAALSLLAIYSGQKLIRSHLDPRVSAPKYEFERPLPACRGGIYSAYGRNFPLAKSVAYWEYRLDPVALTNCVASRRKFRTKEEILKTISETAGLDYERVRAMMNKTGTGRRSQLLLRSLDEKVHQTMADEKLVAGVAINDSQVRQYLHGRSLCHVLGSVNANHDGSAGIEIKYDQQLKGQPGMIRGEKDARGFEIYSRRKISIPPEPGDDIFLTVDHNIQFETEKALKWGIGEFEAGTGWCIVMDVKTGAILAMASLPDFLPENFGKTPASATINRAVAVNYEPGSVMKVITACAAIDSNPRVYGPRTIYNTNRYDERYFNLPGDGSHKWEPTMTLEEAIVHSSNIVIGKLACDIGQYVLYDYMHRFGFGQKTGIELPGEEKGSLKNPKIKKWDKASQSRAGIGQSVSVTAIQLIGAYQSIANDGLRMQPYIIDRIESHDGQVRYKHEPQIAARTISPETARKMRQMMLGVATTSGTARRAAIRGYSVAGKTGTAQKTLPGVKGYADGLYRATFCGIVPAINPQVVVLVTLDFDKRTRYHQGGNSAAPVFKRVALAAIRYLGIQPDRPDELENIEEDEFDQIVNERLSKYDIISPTN